MEFPNCPFELYLVTPYEETISNWVNRQDKAVSITEIATHFRKPVQDIIDEIYESRRPWFGFIFRPTGEYPTLELEPGTLVFTRDAQIPKDINAVYLKDIMQ